MAILEASTQVEFYDDELGGEFYQAGIATLPIVQPAAGSEEQYRRLRQVAEEILPAGKFLLSLGGEHSITVPLFQAVVGEYGRVSVLQIDAHGDLRDSYDQTKYSHACVMRRLLESTDHICQVGIRSFSREEVEQCPRQVKAFITPKVIVEDTHWIDRVLGLLSEKVYVTVDMDGFDPSIAPGVGTPEPDGLTWRQATSLLRRVCTERQVVAADIVETRPIPPHHITEFLAAKLAYKIIAYTQR